MSLVRAEFRRFFARRFILIMVALILVVLASIALGFALNTHRITAADRTAAKAEAARIVAEQRQALTGEYTQCLEDKLAGNGKFAGMDCTEIQRMINYPYQPSPDEFLPTHFDFRLEIQRTLYIAAAILGLFGFVVGASFVGAEWTSGGLTNLMLWRPRRVPVMAAKLGTALASVFAVGAAYLVLWVGTMYAIGRFGGVSTGATAGFWRSTALTSLRALTVGLAAAAIGFALASLGRRTAAALGIGIGYALVAELGTYIVFQMINTAFPDRFRLSTYLGAWMNKRLVLTDQGFCRYTIGECRPREFVVNLGLSAWVGGTIVALLVAAALLTFRRRDVT